MKKTFFLAFLCLTFATTVFSQANNANSLLWKVSGNGLTNDSYLFGTYHFLSNAFVDTLPAVTDAYKATKAVIGELVIDSSLQAPMMEAAMLKGTTLKTLLPDSIYAKTAHWFTREAGLDLANLNTFNPISVMTVALAITQQKYYPNKPGEIQLDTYFQELAKRDGKKIMGLETIEMQIKAMYGPLSLQRQTSLLYDAVKDDDGLKELIGIMNTAYISQNLNDLQDVMYGSSYEQKELEALLDNRNNYWMQQLPQLMKEQSSFIAVGALHLVGKTGLIEQLRNLGYNVTPVNI